jgi:hypothetical protein
MSETPFSHYKATIEGGPGHVAIDVLVEYYNVEDEFVGQYGEHLIAFATTWRDVATVVRTGLHLFELDVDPLTNISPMVDLS